MKHSKKLIGIILLTFVIVISAIFVSCDKTEETEETLSPEEKFEKMSDAEKSEYLSQKSDEYFKDGFACVYTTTATISGTMSDMKYHGDMTINGENTTLFPGTEKFSALEKTVTKTTSRIGNSKETTTTTTEIDGFVGGETMIYAYIPDETASTHSKYYKYKCTADQYLKIVEKRTLGGFEDINDLDFENFCKDVSVKKSEDGKAWIITYSGISSDSEFVKEFTDSLSSSMGNVACETSITKISVVLTVDTETSALTDTVVEMEIGMTGELIDLKFDILTEMTISKTEGITDLTPDNIDKYQDNPALLHKDVALSAYKKAVQKSNAYVTLKNTIYITGKYNNYSQVLTNYRETDRINYGKLNDKFCYFITSKIRNLAYNDTELTVKYNGSTETIITEDETETSEKTEAQAKAYINGLVQQHFIDEEQIQDMSRSRFGDGSVTITFTLFPSDKGKALVSSLTRDFSRIQNFKETLIIKIDKDMNPISVMYSVYGEYKKDGYFYSYDYDSTLSEFGEADLSGIDIPETSASAK